MRMLSSVDMAFISSFMNGLGMMLSENTIASRPHAVTGLHRELGDLNVDNLLLWMSAVAARKYISKDAIRRISHIPVLLLAGAQAPCALPLLPVQHP